MPDYREVLIKLDYDSETAEIWCARRTCEGKLKRLGFTQTGQQIGGVWFRGPLRGVTFRSIASLAAKTARKGNPAALAKARIARQG